MTDPEADRAALADNVQRTVERTALRKVRKLVDELEDEQAGDDHRGRYALIALVAVIALLLLWLVSGAIDSDKKFNRGEKIDIPDKATLPKTN